MSETKESGPTVYKAMDLFQNITQASAFTSKEVALFYTLLQAWNAGRRPSVIEQWAGVTCQNAGLTLKTLSSARNKLVQKGVIYFEKTGNRSAPKYSLDALFGKPNPLLSILTSKRASKGRVNGRVKGDSKQGKEKEKEKGSPPVEVKDFQDDDLQEAWELWLQARKEKRQPVKPTARTLQIKKIKNLSKADALAMLKHSTENGYTGLYQPNNFQASGKPDRNRGTANSRASPEDFNLQS